MTGTEPLVPIGFIEIGFSLLALGLLFGAWLSRRAQVQPLGYWPAAWAVLIGIGAMRLAGVPNHFEYVGTAIYCALLLAGAYRYADRPVPTQLFPIATGVAIVLFLLAHSSAAEFAAFATLALSPIVILAAAAIVHRAARERRASLVHRVVPIGIVIIAALGAYDHIVMNRSVDAIAMWLLAGVPIATNQAIAVFDRIQARGDQIAHELEESVSLLQATLDSTTDGILVVNLEGLYTTYNQMFGAMWEIPDEILARGVSEDVLRFAKQKLKDPDGFYSTVKSLYANPEAESFDTLQFKDGRCFERYSSPQRVGDEIVGRVWSFRDVTPRRRAEDEAARYRDHLEEVVQERTRQLVESRDRLRQADRLAAIGTLAAGVAHQINNPIGAIMNSAEYALLCDGDDDAMEIFRNALQVNAEEAKRCGAIVRGMLQFARQEPVQKMLEDLNQVVRLSLKAVDRYARERKAEIHVELAVEPIQLRMSLLEMEQVVVNLLRNAIESRDTGAVVRVRTFAASDGAHVEVIDNGVGIEEQDQGRIFDPFYSTRLMQGGTGLGLSVAHGILTDHGGKIRVASDRGRGTKITIDLPLEIEARIE